VGGFFGEPNAELFTRWYQAGAFTPFFRGHAHLDTKRREPWVFGDPYTGLLRAAAMQRYSLLPLWYTVFYEAYATGLPVMRTMWMEFPEDASTFALDAQWMVGSALLVAPVTSEGQKSVRAYLPAQESDGTPINHW
jgi:alpha 1,3-glucosidase